MRNYNGKTCNLIFFDGNAGKMQDFKFNYEGKNGDCKEEKKEEAEFSPLLTLCEQAQGYTTHHQSVL